MALPARQQFVYWGLAALVFLAVLWGLGAVLLPFLVGGAIAYFLDPVADRLERLGLSRVMATALIALIATLGFVVGGLLIVPMLVRQLAGLVAAAPDMTQHLLDFLNQQFPQMHQRGSVINETLQSLGEAVKARGGELAQTVLTSAMSLVNFAIFVVVVPVVAFYMLLDWDRMIARVDSWLPRDHLAEVRAIAREIDKVLSGFVRGQVSVCVIMGTFYAALLMLAGLNFGLLAGAIAGTLTFIPYVGAILGGGLAIGLALYQFWGDWLQIGIVVGIFGLGQFLEGNVITPKFVGQSIGLHPLWLIFALSAFGTLFGFVGMLVAVPVAAVIGVLARFMLMRYLKGELYLGQAGTEQDRRG
ncbi:AI-2E family transporter [Paenirhodobacter enshiensis]|uniref:Membrane protein n=1 Tax=Paenirhodobacter enshiensis TaxID=1105367 RepID=A0A086Y972_9RHOB|nr:AI-2E family transporter [Paenirhodobacter enshiensis]KFI30822.1 membrane protein [Paenirhodobacter enshiensis]